MARKSDGKCKESYLVCVNNEAYSEVALDYAAKLSKKVGADIVILHVAEPADYQTIGAVADKIRHEKKEDADKMLKSLSEIVEVKHGLSSVTMFKEGIIEDEIIKVINSRKNIGMLVVGAAPQTSSKSKTLAPIVSKSGNKVRIPILIVPGNVEEG